MGRNTIDDILGNRPQQTAATPEAGDDKFFGIKVGEGVDEHFLEIRFKDGARLCVSYSELSWFTYDSKQGLLELDFWSSTIHIKGRGLGGRLFDGIRQKRLAWVKEADSEMQDHPGNDVFIQEISFPPPEEEGSGSEK